MAKINYVVGDATNPQGEGNKIICHICNNIGAWGAGFVLAVSKKWKTPEIAYRAMKNRKLGDVQFVRVADDIIVANMIGQHGVGISPEGVPPIRYDAVEESLKKINQMLIDTNSTLHMPRIGCGLAGGKWDIIESIILKTISVPTYVYDLK